MHLLYIDPYVFKFPKFKQPFEIRKFYKAYGETTDIEPNAFYIVDVRRVPLAATPPSALTRHVVFPP